MTELQNERGKLLGIVVTTSQFGGVLVGTAVAAGKKIELCIRGTKTTQQPPLK